MKSLPRPNAWSDGLPDAAPPDDMAIYQLPTGTYGGRAAFAVKGGSFRDKRLFAATPILVMHPKGDLVIDAGFGSHVDEHVATLPLYQRPSPTKTQTVREQLDASGYDRNRLAGVLLTHSHWDHVGGLEDLDVPIWITPAEEGYANSSKNRDRVYRIVAPGHQIREYAFPGPSYLGFPSSFDVFRDGSVVIVPAGGHTPGSVIIFVTLPSRQRYAFIGDLTWQLDGIDRRVERPWLLRKLADTDPEQVRQSLLRVIALAGLMQVVPAHDPNAYKGIPRLPVRFAGPSDSAPGRRLTSPPSVVTNGVNEPAMSGDSARIVSNSDSERYRRGVEAYASQFHMRPEDVPGWFAKTVGSRFGEESIQSAANAWTDNELSLRDRSFIVIAALIAQGDLEGQLRMHTRWALDHGATPAQLDALATLLAIYSGFARASHGLVIIRDELAKLAVAGNNRASTT